MYRKIRKCDFCNSGKFDIVINKKGPSMLSDQKIINKNLKKIKCKRCGLIFNEQIYEKQKTLENYKKKYSYNTSKEGDVFFFSKEGFQDRSSQIFEWIIENIPKTYLNKAKSIVEVGCGEGKLLSKFAKNYPEKKIVGYELNSAAIKLGRKKGLDIRNLNKQKRNKADIVISFAVIEHTHSPKKFFRSLIDIMNDDGILILGQPDQDKIYYDIFFWDHIFHFSSKHIEDYGRLMNLVQIKKSKMKWPIETFSLHLFRKSKRRVNQDISYHRTQVKNSVRYYEKVFSRINYFLENLRNKDELSVFGLGEIFSLFYTYTHLGKTKIKYGIDDFPKKNENFPFPVLSTQEALKNFKGPILFCVNPRYYKVILKKFHKTKHEIFLPFTIKTN